MITIDFVYAAAILMFVGAIGGLFQTQIIDKILLLAVLTDGIVAFISTFGYLDVAMSSSFFSFVGIIILMVGLIRIMEIRKSKGELS
jgi:energy-converting hydrogenase A subunit D